MATIRKRNGKFQVQVRRSGKQCVTKSFVLLADAKEWANLKEREADRGELGLSMSSLDAITLGDLVDRYIKQVVPKKKSKVYETLILNAFRRDDICNRSLNQLSTKDFARYRDQRLQEIKSSSLKRQLNPIQNMFEVAKVDWEIPIKENPLVKLRLDVIDNKRQRRLQAGEYNRLLEAARTRQNPWIEKLIIFAVETAMRRGEIFALRCDVNLERRCVAILESKNGYSRTIPLTPKAHDMLQGLQREDDRVFPVTKNALKMAWGRMMILAEIDDLRFHDLRHEAVSRFFEMGLTVPEVASISGHRDMKMLMRYAHASEAVVLEKLHHNSFR